MLRFLLLALLEREPRHGYDLKAVDMTRGNIAQYDCVVIVTDHKAFEPLRCELSRQSAWLSAMIAFL